MEVNVSQHYSYGVISNQDMIQKSCCLIYQSYDLLRKRYLKMWIEIDGSEGKNQIDKMMRNKESAEYSQYLLIINVI